MSIIFKGSFAAGAGGASVSAGAGFVDQTTTSAGDTRSSTTSSVTTRDDAKSFAFEI